MQTNTAENTQTAAPQPAQSKGEVALIAPPRLPFHPLIEQRFGIDRAAWRALTDAVFPAAKTTDAVVLALSYCKARKLDPFKRVVHIVPVWDSEKGEYVETVWPGIAEHRTTAFRTKQYAGADAATFGPTIEQEFSGTTKKGNAVRAKVKFPEWCQLTVYRLIDGDRVAVPGPRVYWLETYSRMGRIDVPNERWQRAPFQMIEKCAEAAALRRAFPEEIGDEPTAEEVGAYQGADNAKDVTPPARPTRADFDETTGEVLEPATEADERAADRMTERAIRGEDPAGDEEQAEEAKPAQPTPSPWRVSAEAFPSPEDFTGELRRLLTDECKSKADVADCMTANVTRYRALDKATRGQIDKLAGARKAGLAA